MDMDNFTEALKAMDMLSGRETLRQLSIHDWPSLKSQERDKFHRDISKQANLKKKIVKMDDIDAILGAR